MLLLIRAHLDTKRLLTCLQSASSRAALRQQYSSSSHPPPSTPSYPSNIIFAVIFEQQQYCLVPQYLLELVEQQLQVCRLDRHVLAFALHLDGVAPSVIVKGADHPCLAV